MDSGGSWFYALNMNAHDTLQAVTPQDLVVPGLYWYFDEANGDPLPVLVGSAEAPRADWEVQFHGRADADRLDEISGTFIGPIAPPLRPE